MELNTMVKMFTVASIATGIQFGWALQLSLLTPYVEILGIPHKWASLIWLCGPISGLIVQPIVGYYSDRCGRRRPFILFGCVAVAIAALLIGHAADIGHSMGDNTTGRGIRPRATAVFVVGFWILDVANNMLQGPCRAFLGDLADGDHNKTRVANAFFVLFMAIGNVLGYAVGSIRHVHKVLPFAQTKACNESCVNLKTCFLISIFFLWAIMGLALFLVPDKQASRERSRDGGDASEDAARAPCLGQIVGAFRELSKPMRVLMVVTALNWLAWFPFLLFDTDWVGKEIYGGHVAGSFGDNAYYNGMRVGSLGLMLNSIVLGLMSMAVERIGHAVGGVKYLWGIVNFILAISMSLTILLTKIAEQERHLGGHVSEGIKVGVLMFFAVLGVPLAITYNVPFALASIYSSTSGAGQGLSLGFLNLAIVIPQIIVSTLSGLWDGLFGGGNLPAFVVGAVAAAASGIIAIFMLPAPDRSNVSNSTPRVGGFH